MIMPKGIDKDLISASTQLKTWMKDIRRHIHAHPELSFKEEKTATFIQERLLEIGIASEGGIAQTGVVARISGNASPGPVVALRADMDALPVQMILVLCMPVAMTAT